MNRISSWLQPPVFDDPDKSRRARLLHRVLLITGVVFGLYGGYLLTIPRHPRGHGIVTLLFAGLLFAMLPLLRRGLLTLVAYSAILLGLAIQTSVMWVFLGSGSADPVILLIIVVGASTFIEARGTTFITALAAVVYIITIVLQQQGLIASAVFDPVTGIVVVTLGIGLIGFIVTQAQRQLRAALQLSRQQSEAFAQINVELEQRVAARTSQLRTVAEVARATASVQDPDALMSQAVERIRADFALYYAGIFLLDEARRYAVLRAGSGRAGQAMLAAGHRLEIGGRSMIGQAVASGLPRVALDVGAEAVHFANPHLPLTRTELALPLKVGETTLGALTIQSTEPEAFDNADIATFQGLADQLATALNNAHLFAEQQVSLERIRQLNQALLGGAWQVTAEGAGYIFEDDALQAQPNVQLANLAEALQTDKPVVAADGEDPLPRVTLPIRLRDEVLGALEVTPTDDRPAWSDEELALLEQIVRQTAYALENARLIDQVQQTLNATREAAERERTLQRISSELRESTDVETILKTTLARLGAVLGATSGEAELGLAIDRPTENGGAAR